MKSIFKGKRGLFASRERGMYLSAIFLVQALFLGVLAAALPWLFSLALVALLAYVWAVWLFPSVGLYFLGVVCIASPDVKIADAATVVTLALLLVRSKQSRQSIEIPKWIEAPYILLLLSIFVSLVLGISVFHNSIVYAYRDVRGVAYLALLPFIYSIGKHRGTAKVENIVIAVGLTVAALTVTQWMTGRQLIAGARVAALLTEGADQSDLTRVQFSGFVFVPLVFVWVFLKALDRPAMLWLNVALMGLLVVALYANFGRAFWLATIAATLIALMLSDRRARIAGGAFLVMIGLLGGGGLWMVKPQAIENVVVRMASISSEGGSGTSLGWRKLENADAVVAIEKSPFLGIGMGGEYRGWIRQIATFAEHTHYVHNSYIWYLLKAGPVALFSLLWLFIRSWRIARPQFSNEERPSTMLTAVRATFPCILIICFTQPELASPAGVFFFCCCVSLMCLAGGAQIKQASAFR